jgi:hypothetical protein
MTTTEIDLHRPQAQPSAISAKLAYARELANSGLLPAAYRKNPGNILWAIEYGDMLGLSVMAAITGVHVIDGKPTASAGLISGLVRLRGHKLRVWGDNKSATCEITRSDDPKHPFTVTWTLRTQPGDNPSAELAGLLGKNTWKNYPASMLKSRAITQCARDACEEALFGLHYTPEELGAEVDEDGVVVDNQPRGRGTIFIDPECLVENEQSRLAERSGGTPDDDQWYGPDPDADTAEDTPPPWDTDRALKEAAGFTNEAAGTELWLAAGQAQLDGKCTPGERDHIQNLVTARITDRRKEAMSRLLRQLSENDEWRLKVEELSSDEEAHGALRELRQLTVAGTVDGKRSGRISRAIIARYPKAALNDPEAAA